MSGDRVAPGPVRVGGPGATASQQRAIDSMVLGFGFSLGIGTLALPLVALAAGYDPAAVGFLTAVSAIAQLALRLALPWLLGRFADRDIVGVGSLALAASYTLLLIDTSLVAFLAAQLLQGTARAQFWTASQTHVVRAGGDTVRPLARLQAVSSVGQLTGPAVAGFVATRSLELALLLGAATGLLAAVCTLGMGRLPPFERRAGSTGIGIWRRPGVDVACWSSVAAAGWRAMLNSFVPVTLTSAGLGPSVVGVLLAVSDGSALVSAAALMRVTVTRARRLVEISVIASCAGLAVLPFVASEAAIVAVILGVGGAGQGILTTLAPALANDAVAPHERGDAIAATGTFRAVALLAAPAGVASALSVVTLPVALVVTSIILATPIVASGIRSRQRIPEGGVP